MDREKWRLIGRQNPVLKDAAVIMLRTFREGGTPRNPLKAMRAIAKGAERGETDAPKKSTDVN